MHRRPPLTRLPSTTLYIAILVFFFGCDALPFFAGNGLVDPGSTGRTTEGLNDNSVFDAAQPLTMPDSGQLVVDGTIDARDDIDIYDLGAAESGDRITIDVSGVDGLNTVAALFNQDRELIDANDDRNYFAGQVDPYLSQVIRSHQSRLYLGIAVTRGTHFSSNTGRYDTGAYSIRVTRRPGDTLLPRRQQVVYLNFEGGTTVQIASQPAEIMRPFSVESITSRLDGKSDFIVQRVVELMHEDYAGYDVVIYDSRSGPAPSAPHTTLYFGNYNSAFLGLSENVDTGNARLEQKAIIYTEDFQLFELLQPTAEELAQAIANTGSHELGHLLGLEHTADPFDVMATAATARQIMENDASLLRSPLLASVFPAGWQNGPALMMENIGQINDAFSRLILPDSPATARVKSSATWREAIDIPITPCSRCAEGH